MSCLHTHSLFEGALARAIDVCCTSSASPCGDEEHGRAHQLIFIRSGVFVKHSGPGGRREVVAEPMHVLCLNHDEPYRVSHPADGGDDCTALSFTADAVLDATAIFDPLAADHPSVPFRITHAPLTPDVLFRFRALRRALRTGAASGSRFPDTLAVEDEALMLLGLVLRDGYHAHGVRHGIRTAGHRSSTMRDRRELVERTKEALAIQPGKTWSLAALAREVNSSPYHLTRVFREHVGLPVHGYLLRLRFAIALERIEAGESNLSTIALALGFSSHSHFTTAFRRAFGAAPTVVARQLASPTDSPYRSKTCC